MNRIAQNAPESVGDPGRPKTSGAFLGPFLAMVALAVVSGCAIGDGASVFRVEEVQGQILTSKSQMTDGSSNRVGFAQTGGAKLSMPEIPTSVNGNPPTNLRNLFPPPNPFEVGPSR